MDYTSKCKRKIIMLFEEKSGDDLEAGKDF